MVNRFVTSDTHFGHENSWKLFKKADGTPLRPFSSTEEMDQAMVDRWNKIVGPKDKVYHLGDVVISRKNLKILSQLNGQLRLIGGNHDIFSTNDYMKYFKRISGAYVLEVGNARFVLTHIPIHPTSQPRWAGGNIHGHLHDKRVLGKSNLPDENYICVSVERTDFTPVPVEEIEKYRGPSAYDIWISENYENLKPKY